MKKLHQKGFSVVEVLIIFVVIGLIGGVGWYVWSKRDMQGTSETTVTSRSTSPAEQPEKVDPYEGWVQYESEVGGFSVKFPAEWTFTGFQDDLPVELAQVNNQETVFRATAPSTDESTGFGINFYIVNRADSGAPFDTYPNGETTVMDNGLTLWQEKENVAYATGPEKSTCPSLQTGTDKSFYSKLENGKYLNVYGSFCWAQKSQTTLNYAEQVKSSEWRDAIKILESIRFQ